MDTFLPCPVTKNCNFFAPIASNSPNQVVMEPLSAHQLKTGSLSDLQVVARIKQGEKELYEILLRRYNQTLYRIVRSYVREEEAEDIMQDTYVKAYEKLSQFRGNAAFSTWLIRIGINEALQFLRNKKRFNMVNQYDDACESNKLLNIPDAHNMNPENQLIHQEGRQLIEKTIDQLPEKYRIVYVLREVEGMKNPEIAACLQITENNVKVRLHRAKHLMQKMLYRISSNVRVFEFGNSRCDRMVSNVMQRIQRLKQS